MGGTITNQCSRILTQYGLNIFACCVNFCFLNLICAHCRPTLTFVSSANFYCLTQCTLINEFHIWPTCFMFVSHMYTQGPILRGGRRKPVQSNI